MSASTTPSRPCLSATNRSRTSGSTPTRPFSISTRTRFCASDGRSPAAPASTPYSWSDVTPGSPSSSRTAVFSATAASRSRTSAQAASLPSPSATLKTASAYGRAIVAISAMGLLQLALEPGEHLRVRLRVDFAAQDLLGAGDREGGDLLAERLLRARDLLRDLGLGAG